MIYFVLKRVHSYCLAALGTDFGWPVPPHVVLAYEDLFDAAEASPGIYIFCDLERLADAELDVAADVAALMANEPGFRVLNDPARVRVRYAFLRAMREAGLNAFDAYRADGLPRPRRFPVFVRSEGAHNAPLSPLLPDQAALDAALSAMRAAAQPLRGLIVIEYCAEAFTEGVWRRYGTYRIGDAFHLHDVVSEASWNVKYGQPGLVDDATYAIDHERMLTGFMVDELREAFAIAAIDYGRADFGLVGGRPQVYEINTNPCIQPLKPHASEVRVKSMNLAHETLARHLVSLALTHESARGRPLPLRGHRIEGFRQERHEERRRPQAADGASSRKTLVESLLFKARGLRRGKPRDDATIARPPG